MSDGADIERAEGGSDRKVRFDRTNPNLSSPASRGGADVGLWKSCSKAEGLAEQRTDAAFGIALGWDQFVRPGMPFVK